MIDAIICIMFRWIAAGLFVMGCVLTAGCLLASVFFAVHHEGKEALRMLGWMMASAGLAAGCVYSDYRLIDVYYGYYDQSAKYIGYIFPGLVSLFFFPEPLRRGKLRLKLRRARYGSRPKEEAEIPASTRVTSLPTRRR